MAAKPLSDEIVKKTLDAYLRLGLTAAAAEVGVTENRVQHCTRLAKERGFITQAQIDASQDARMRPDLPRVVDDDAKILALKDQISDLKKRLTDIHRETLDEQYIKQKILGLFDQSKLQATPEWTLKPSAKGHTIGIPITVWSDWHFGERVFPSQVNGVNEYDLTIARQRVRKLINRTVDLLKNHMVNPNYPGIMIALIGDLVSGGIHDELAATDDASIMPTVLEVFGVLKWALGMLADEFGHVWVVGLAGNHGRITKKIWQKNRNFTNFDWLICKFLAETFKDDPRFDFMVPDGLDARVLVYGHPYLFTHGDRLGKGGDGIIGSAGPIIRGTVRKAARDSQINQDFATLVHGHYHQYSPGNRIIGNGSLVGYSEYAYIEGYSFEVPQQALWIHNPKRGLTFHMSVHLEDVEAGIIGKYSAKPVAFGRMS